MYSYRATYRWALEVPGATSIATDVEFDLVKLLPASPEGTALLLDVQYQ